jgi:hypothetical protein
MIKEEDIKEPIDNLSPNWGIMLTMQENLNLRIGVRRRKKYISAAFWNYISTPINFIITLFTALSASQTGTSSTFLSTNQVFYVLLTTFILSIINTFFKLKEKAQLNYDAAKMYEQFGTEFEKIYFEPILKTGDVEKKLKDYNELNKKIMTYSNHENIDGVNYITEFIYYFWSQKFNKKLRHIERSERYWVLDGKPQYKYRNNYKIKKDLFIENFNEISLDKKEERHGMFNIGHWNWFGNEPNYDNDSVIDKYDNENIQISIQENISDKPLKTLKTSKTAKGSKKGKNIKRDKNITDPIDDDDEEYDSEDDADMHDDEDDSTFRDAEGIMS